MLGTEYRVADYRHSLSLEQSVTNEPLSSMNKQRVLLPLEPDFNTMSDRALEILKSESVQPMTMMSSTSKFLK